jgi:hypothetical protein
VLNILWWIPTGTTILAKKAKQIQSPKRQVEAFRKAARELGCDESEERFQAALRAVTKAKPSPAKRKGT